MARILLTVMIGLALAWSVAGDPLMPRAQDAVVPGPAAASVETADKHGDDDGGDDDDSGHGGGDEDPVTVSGTIPDGSLVIDILDDDGYTPASLEIDLGQQVTWVNQHHDEHTATGALFDTDVIGPGQTATVTFDSPGRFAFACQFHPEMTGTIAVRGLDGIVPEPSPQASAPSEAQAVVIDNRTFTPPALSVPLGMTVVWTNASDEPHTVTAKDGSFGSDILSPDETFSQTFDTEGTFAYACRLHDEMQAVIVVGSGAGASVAPGGPSASAPPV